MLFARGNKTIEGQGVFAHVGVNQEGDFGVQVAEGGEGGERDLHEVADAADVHEDLIRALVSETSAKLANHRGRVFSTGGGSVNAVRRRGGCDIISSERVK